MSTDRFTGLDVGRYTGRCWTFAGDLANLKFWKTLRRELAANKPSEASYKTLNFGDKFNQNLNEVHLPSFLESLTFGNNFNQSLDLVTFPQLLSLTFGERFNQSLEHVALPRTLRSLKFGYEYDQPLEHVKWPDALEEFLGFEDMTWLKLISSS